VTDLIEFLKARLAEDEQVARAADGLPDVEVSYSSQAAQRAQYAFLERYDPPRMLVEIKAKRWMIDEAERKARTLEERPTPGGLGVALHMRTALRHLALPYADHPDYDEAWRP
jgi:Family of unknown function (DUF6221)